MVSPLPFVGRDREMALLREALDSAISGRGAVVLISGEPGIGKTTLAELICLEAGERGALVLTGRCYDLTETAPFAPWVEIFNAYPASDALPELPSSVTQLESGEDSTGQVAIFAPIQRFLAETATARPLVLLLDDQHWADDASLDLLRFLARGANTLPLLILVTYRADELVPTHYLSQLLPLLAREARALRLNLGPLSYDDLWAIIRPRYQLEASEEARLTSYLHDRTEGNPFFTGELLQMLEEEGVLRQAASGWQLGDLGTVRTPILVEHIVGGRLAQLSEGDQRLLAVASVLGQELSLALWAEVAETDQVSILELLDRASRARLMVETPDGRRARFTHDLVRQVIYGQLAPSLRHYWHQRAGTVLAAAAVPDPDAVASHFRRSGDPRAVEWLIRAGDRAQRAYSWQEAAERFEAAVEALGDLGKDAEKRGWLLVRVARMLRYAAPEIGLARLEEAGRIAEATGDRPLTAMVLWQSGLLRCLQGRIQFGIELFTRGVTALDALTPAERERLRGNEPLVKFLFDEYQSAGTLALWLSEAGRFAEALTYAAPYVAEPVVPAGAEGTFADAYSAFARAQAMLGHAEEARLAYARAYAAYRDDHHNLQLARVLINELQMCVLPYEADNLAERRRLETEAELAWKRGTGALAGDFAGAMRLPLDYVEGRWTELTATAMVLGDQGTSSMRAEAACWLGPVAHARGDTDLVRQLVREWLPAGPAATPGDTVYRAARVMQEVAAAQAIRAGDFPAARRWLEAADRWLAWSGGTLGKAAHALSWAAFHRACDDLSEARQHAETALQLASDPRQPLVLIAVHRMLGELDTAEVRYGDAAAHLDLSLTFADACAAPYERALTLLALAELELAQGSVVTAATHLSSARAIFEQLGAKPALARAEALAGQVEGARSAGPPGLPETPIPSTISDDDRALLARLSRREIDVLRLLPAGRTNQEIADLLFLSPKTVENHIGRILAKTGLPNRAAAAAFSQRLGLS